MQQNQHIQKHDSQIQPAVQQAGSKAIIALQDNRPAAVLQQKQVDALASRSVKAPLVQKKANTTGLPDKLKSGIENLSGHSMDDVKVHYNSSQPAQLNAHAYAQGTSIHLAPGQEKHLPHEAWHVVQQKQGRVKPTLQMKGKVNVNDDEGLEKEADVMGAKALQKKADPAMDNTSASGVSKSPDATVQRQTAHNAGLLGTYAPGGNVNLYNMQAVNLPQGLLYTKLLPAAPNMAGVINSYIMESRAVGQAFAGRQFLDKNTEPTNLPAVHNWAGSRLNFITALEAWAHSPGAFGALTHAQAVVLRARLTTANRLAARNDNAIGLIDPLVTEVTIPQAGAANWVIETNYSEASNGYITLILDGSKNVTGRIRPSDTFAAVAALAPAAGHFQYSSAHDQGVNHDVGHQINSIQAGATNQQNHEGFDAVAKLGGEGARFEPVRQLGTALKVNSRFYFYDAATNTTKYLTFITLYQRWGHAAWFNRAYGITAAQVRAMAVIHGVVLAGPVDLAHDYDLDNGDTASSLQGHYTGIITGLVNGITDCERKKRTSAGKRNQKAIADYNRGQNRQIDQLKTTLAPYRRMYPALYNAVRNPPPPVAILPVAGPQPNHGMRNLVIAGVLVGAFLLNELRHYMYGTEGFLYPYGPDEHA